jgi:uncharacterized membrane protein
MRNRLVLGLEDTTIVTKDAAGASKLRPNPVSSKGLSGLLAALIFRSEARDYPVEAWESLDAEFVTTVGTALQNGGSALLFFLHPESLSDSSKLFDALALFRGRIHQTTLPPQTEARLRELS